MERLKDYIQRAEVELKNGNWVGARGLIMTAIDLVGAQTEDAQTKRILAEALRLKAYAESRIGDFKSAVTDAKRALELSETLSDVEGQADALRRLGYVHWQKTDFPMALEFYETALKKANEAKARKLIGKITIELGNLYNSMNDFEKARVSYLQAAVIMKEEKELNELARIYNNLGDLYFRSKRFKDSLKALDQCIILADQIGDQTIKGWAAFNSANALLRLGNTKDALEHLNTAMMILRRTDDRIGVMTTYLVYGEVYTALKDWDKASASFKKATAIVKDLQMPALEAEILGAVGKMYAAKGDRPVARDNLLKGIAMYEEAGLKKEASELKSVLDQIGSKT